MSISFAEWKRKMIQILLVAYSISGVIVIMSLNPFFIFGPSPRKALTENLLGFGVTSAMLITIIVAYYWLSIELSLDEAVLRKGGVPKGWSQKACDDWRAKNK